MVDFLEDSIMEDKEIVNVKERQKAIGIDLYTPR